MISIPSFRCQFAFPEGKKQSVCSSKWHSWQLNLVHITFAGKDKDGDKTVAAHAKKVIEASYQKSFNQNFQGESPSSNTTFILTHGYGCFRKWWYPQIIQFIRDFHYKSSILGYPCFWKHPYESKK